MTAGKILKAIHEVMTEVGYVKKDSENSFHHYKYASEASLLGVLRPAMLKAGLVLIPSSKSHTEIDAHGNIFVKIAYTLAHKDGEVWPEKIYALGAGGDKNKGGVGDKGLYKAITGANKYLLFKLFQLETGDDPERDGPDNAGKKNSNTRTPTPASDEETKWRKYANDAGRRISKANNEKEIEAILHEPAMEGLKDFSMIAYDDLTKRGMNRLGAIASTP